MKLTILGSGTHIPVKHRSNPAYLLDIDNQTVLLDCGSGTLRQIAKANRSEWEINKIFLSHLHIDHTIDLVPLFFTYKYQKKYESELKEIPIFAHPDFSERLEALENIYGKWINAANRKYKHIAMKSDQNVFDDFKIETFQAEHTDQSLIFRLTDSQNRKFVYSGDTSPTEELIRAAYRVDLLLIECSGCEDSETKGHLSPKDVKSIIFESKPTKTIVTHINQKNDTKGLLQKVTPKNFNVEIAHDLDIFDIDP